MAVLALCLDWCKVGYHHGYIGGGSELSCSASLRANWAGGQPIEQVARAISSKQWRRWDVRHAGVGLIAIYLLL